MDLQHESSSDESVMETESESSDDEEELEFTPEEEEEYTEEAKIYTVNSRGERFLSWFMYKLRKADAHKDDPQEAARKSVKATLKKMSENAASTTEAIKDMEAAQEKVKEAEAALVASRKLSKEKEDKVKQMQKEGQELVQRLDALAMEAAGGAEHRLIREQVKKLSQVKVHSTAQPERPATGYAGALMRGPAGPPRGPVGQGWRPMPMPMRAVEPATDKEVQEMEAKFPIPEYVEDGDRVALLAVAGIPGADHRAPGSIRSELAAKLGPELIAPRVEKATRASVNLVVYVKEWSRVCGYLAKAGVQVLPELSPEKPRPGGSGDPAEDLRRAQATWLAWARGPEHYSTTQLGRSLMARYARPQLTEEQAATAALVETRRLAHPGPLEEGEIRDVRLPAPGPAPAVAGQYHNRYSPLAGLEEDMVDDADRAGANTGPRKRKAGDGNKGQAAEAAGMEEDDDALSTASGPASGALAN
ncbi:hypothetical protein IWQ57_004173 [Coemansia nantahalensis]|uniref:Uncharacterized protein n=1 Tax=Coemansia nantahalensis TaxID=2789366 RepID=A0ACC1JTL1_9FUNG|nr:hypothetical protein IWQ57_004173 [Coemansia nantahalensis]